MIDLDKAMLDPSEVFDSPEAVASHDGLTIDQKISILRQWEYDEIEMSVAEAENMASANHADEARAAIMDSIHHLIISLEREKRKAA